MISYLSWKVIDIEQNKITLLMNSWIWYDIFMSEASILNLTLDWDKSFYIYHHITEANQSLFGFLEKVEKHIFEELIKISWVWWKVAINILSLWAQNLIDAICNWDNNTIESVKWVWKKMAEKILLELKDKDIVTSKSFNKVLKTWNNQLNNLEKNLQDDIFTTLINMWYDKKSIDLAVSKIPNNLDTMEQIFPALIKEIG